MNRVTVLQLRQSTAPLRRLLDSPFLAWARHLDSLVLVVFVCGSMFLSGENQLRTLGIAMCAVFFFTHVLKTGHVIKQMRPIPLELVCYTAWVVWAGATGVFVADDFELFREALTVILQMNVLVWVISGILSVRRKAAVGVFLAIIAGGLIQILSVFLEGIPDVNRQPFQRIYGLTENPNGLGFLMLYTLFAALFLWGLPTRKLKWAIRAGVIGLFPVCAYVVGASGSRKSFIALCVLITTWLLFVLPAGRAFWMYFKRFTAVAAIVVFAYFYLPAMMEDTVVQRRFSRFMEIGGGTVQGAAESNVRYEMYRDGLKMFVKNPVFGVGLNNFRVHFYTHTYSHSDYIEPLATTGLIGFLLYQSFFFLVLGRAIRLAKVVQIGYAGYAVRMIVVCMLTIMVIGFGSPHYTQQMIYILLATFCALNRLVENTLSAQGPPARQKIGFRLKFKLK